MLKTWTVDGPCYNKRGTGSTSLTTEEATLGTLAAMSHRLMKRSDGGKRVRHIRPRTNGIPGASRRGSAMHNEEGCWEGRPEPGSAVRRAVCACLRCVPEGSPFICVGVTVIPRAHFLGIAEAPCLRTYRYQAMFCFTCLLCLQYSGINCHEDS